MDSRPVACPALCGINLSDMLVGAHRKVGLASISCLLGLVCSRSAFVAQVPLLPASLSQLGYPRMSSIDNEASHLSKNQCANLSL